MTFYAELYNSAIDIFALNNKLNKDPEIDPKKLFKENVSFAMKCCKSLKPKQMDTDEHYCDPYSSKEGKLALGCETYRGCILDVVIHKDGKNHPLCQTNDTQNENKLNAQDDVTAEPASDQLHENE